MYIMRVILYVASIIGGVLITTYTDNKYKISKETITNRFVISLTVVISESTSVKVSEEY